MPTRLALAMRVALLFGLLVIPLALSLDPGVAGAVPNRPAGAGSIPIQDGGAGQGLPGGLTGVVALMLEMSENASASTYADATAQGASEAQAAQQARAQKARNDQVQQQTVAALGSAVPGAAVIFRVQTAFNGIAVQADASAVAQLRALPGVKAVHYLPPMTIDNASSVPLIGAPAAWQSYGGTGQGVKIGIIDTGIDYVHTNFGGSGLDADYTAARSTSTLPITNGATQLFPNAKVVGGYDFAGNNYNGSNAPAPDQNPLDCASSLGGGHGSHVAGTAAGYGVTSAGATYTGPYNNSTPFDTLRIGPGVAPQAELYALRVFGCTGSTNLTVEAINWAVDPNNDGDPSDRLDVINMSLGSSFGLKDFATSVASDRAAALGVIVVASAGNNGDVTYISGSPGSAPRVLTVASSVDSTDRVDALQVTAPATIDGLYPATRSANYPWSPSTDIAGSLYYPASNQSGCAAWSGTDASNIAGRIVLVDWKQVGDTTFPCGSTQRANNAQAASAIGVVMVDMSTDSFETSIAGNAFIPAVFATSSTGTTLKSELTAGAVSTVVVRLAAENLNQGKAVNPGREDTVSTFTSRGPRGADNGLKPDISAPGQSIFSADSGSGDEGKNLNGTSMAAPHMAGVVALLRQHRPDWSVEEIKALAMNTANHDLYTGENRSGTQFSPQRVGAGRVDVPAAMANTVIAYADSGTGEVGVSFGAVEVVGTLEQTRTIRVSNKGTRAATYTLAYSPRSDLPGVIYDFPDGTTITLAEGQSATVRVRLVATASEMTNARDETMSATQAVGAQNLPRQWLNEESGLVILTPEAGNPASAQSPLRVPVYAVARPASAMTTAESQLVFPNSTGSTTLNLSGQGVGDGTNAPARHTSLLTTFELAATSNKIDFPPGTAATAPAADLKAIGVMSTRRDGSNPSRINNSNLYFGVATHGNWTAPAFDSEIDIYIDVNQDNLDDYLLYNSRLSVNNAFTDVFVVNVLKLSNNTLIAQYFTNALSATTPSAIHNSNVLVLPVAITGTASGLDFGGSGNTRFNYRIVTFERTSSTIIDQSPVLTYDYANPGLDFAGGTTGIPVYYDLPGDTIPATFNQTAYTANNSQGALFLHHYNVTGARDQILPVRLARTLTFTPPANKTFGDAPFVVSATASPSGTPTISSQTPAVCTIDGSNTVTLLAAGNCTLRAAVADDGTYQAASVEATIVVAKRAQTIAFAQPADRIYGDPPFTVSATATSGLPVGFTASGTCVASGPNGSTITPTGVGSCAITANQPGDANNEAAPAVTRTVQIRSAETPPQPYNVTLTIDGPGAATPGGGVYTGTATFTATPNSGAIFLGWTVDGTYVGFANPLVLPVTQDRAVIASFARPLTFSDMPAGSPYAEAIAQLSARGVLRGAGDGTAQPEAFLKRAQMAGLLVRMAGWDGETATNPFRDRCDENGANCIDPALWNEVAVLSFHNVARGFPDNVYLPRNDVAQIQVISFVTRMMVAKGYWTPADADDPSIYPNVPAESGHRLDLITFVRNAGAVPGQPSDQNWAAWGQSASRGWTADILWRAYSSYFATNRIP